MERVWIVVVNNFEISVLDEAEVGKLVFFKGPHSKYFRLAG